MSKLLRPGTLREEPQLPSSLQASHLQLSTCESAWQRPSWRRKCFFANTSCLHAALLPVTCLLLQGCPLITIKYCDGFPIDKGRVLGAWQHDPAVIICDDGYEYTGTELRCDVDRHCTWQDGIEVCKSTVEMVLKADVVQESTTRRLLAKGLPAKQMPMGGRENSSDYVELSQPTQTVPRCTEKTGVSNSQSMKEVTLETRSGHTSDAKQIQQWVSDYYMKWNTHNASIVAASFAVDGRERLWSKDAKGREEVSKANAEVFRKLPNITIELVGVEAFPASNVALAKVSIRNGETHTLAAEDWDVMEFEDDGLLKSMRGSLATISRSLGEDGTLLKIKGLPTNGNVLYLYKVFAPFGAIRDAKVEVNEDGTCKGDGHVEFSFAADAEQASKKLNGHNPAEVRDPSLKPLPSNSKAVLQVSIVTPGE